MIHSRWENREKQRYYRVIFTQDLFGEWTLIKIWGDLNRTGGRTKHIHCQSYEEGLKLIQKISVMRSKHGYEVIIN